MKRHVLLPGFLCLLLAAAPAGGTSPRLITYQMDFRGYSEDTIQGVEEYIVEFPLYGGHRLVGQGPGGREYEYRSAEIPEGIVASLRRMFTYLDAEGSIEVEENRITVTRLGFAPPPPPPDTPPPAPPPSLTVHLSTQRGEFPVFSIGESLDLAIELNQDAWLYCFYSQVDGRMIKFFPNPQHESALMEGGREHRVPGSIYPSEMEFGEPPGNELLTCFATGRDVRPDLPAEFRTPDFSAVPPAQAKRLHELFDGLANTDVARDSLPIAVKR